jgi:hypothetical protein
LQLSAIATHHRSRGFERAVLHVQLKYVVAKTFSRPSKFSDIHIAARLSYPDGRSLMRRHCHEHTEIADADVMRMAIQQGITRSDESRYDHRVHGLLLVTGGHSCQQVANLFREDRRTGQRWVTRFEAHGLTGLRDGARLGRPATLSAKQWAVLGRE